MNTLLLEPLLGAGTCWSCSNQIPDVLSACSACIKRPRNKPSIWKRSLR